MDLLLEAWDSLRPKDYRLVIVGDGPSRADLRKKFAGLDGVVWRGWIDRREVLHDLAQSRCLALASHCYETFSMVTVEALALEIPVVAPDHGTFPDILGSDESSLDFLFEPGSPKSLAETLSAAMELEAGEWLRVSRRAGEVRGQRLERVDFGFSAAPRVSLLLTVVSVAGETSLFRLEKNPSLFLTSARSEALYEGSQVLEELADGSSVGEHGAPVRIRHALIFGRASSVLSRVKALEDTVGEIIERDRRQAKRDSSRFENAPKGQFRDLRRN